MPWPYTKMTNSLNMSLHISLPLIQAPMAGGATTPELVAAVSNAGALGSFAAGYLAADDMRKSIHRIRQLTNKPFAVNLFIPEKYYATAKQLEKSRDIIQTVCHELNLTISIPSPPYAPVFEEQLQVLLEEKIPIFSFTFGIPSTEWIEKFKMNRTTLMGTATTLEEAILLEKSGIDMIIAQGSEAGGHRGTFLGTAEEALHPLSALILLLQGQVHVPIIAAGGIMHANDIIAALTSGAAAVQMGTAFLCCAESGIHPLYKKALLNTSPNNTVLTRAFSGKSARGIRNQFVTRMQPYEQAHAKDILDYPIQHALTIAMRKEAQRQNNIEFMSLWAGDAAHLCQSLPVAQLIAELSEEVSRLY